MEIKVSKSFLPYYKTKLLRVGKNNDGGYLIPENAIKDTKVLYSMGLSDDWSFEEHFLNINNEAKIFTFDGSVTFKFWIKNFILNFIDLISFKQSLKIFLKKSKCFFEYRSFFAKKNVIHIKKNIEEQVTDNPTIKQENSISINRILHENGNNNFSMKIDIEGNEYRIIDDLVENQEGLNFLVIEFHNVDLMESHIKNFIKNLNLDLVHIHVNNYGVTNKRGFAKVIEFTFSNSKYNVQRTNNDFKFPDRSIDQPNNQNFEDIKVNFTD